MKTVNGPGRNCEVWGEALDFGKAGGYDGPNHFPGVVVPIGNAKKEFKMKKFVPVFCAGALLLSLAACGPKQSTDSSGSKQPEVSTSASGGSSQAADPSASQSTPQGAEYTLYIGRDGVFQEYPMTYDGELNELGQVPPEAMIAAMAELTGWNLDLAGEITRGKGSMTVAFAGTCSIFTGLPEEQKEEFRVNDTAELAASILDSIQHTLQYNFADEDGGSPAALDIYYCTADGGSILIPGLELAIPMDEPYHGLNLI